MGRQRFTEGTQFKAGERVEFWDTVHKVTKQGSVHIDGPLITNGYGPYVVVAGDGDPTTSIPMASDVQKVVAR